MSELSLDIGARANVVKAGLIFFDLNRKSQHKVEIPIRDRIT
ncbi:MAG: hypothetical protein QMD82_01690 [bacterium]|nr:hypothetical protein [bacterium]